MRLIIDYQITVTNYTISFPQSVSWKTNGWEGFFYLGIHVYFGRFKCRTGASNNVGWCSIGILT